MSFEFGKHNLSKAEEIHSLKSRNAENQLVIHMYSKYKETEQSYFFIRAILKYINSVGAEMDILKWEFVSEDSFKEAKKLYYYD